MSVIEATILLPGDVTTPAAVRRFVRAALESVEADPMVIETAQLLTDELVTNAILHARTPIDLVVRKVRVSVRVEVFDEGGGEARPLYPELDAAAGRGLGLVQAVANRWGVDDREVGKTVWFEIAL